MQEQLNVKQYSDNRLDPQYKGEDLHEDLVNGPIQSRGCTDILWLIIFIAFCTGMIIISFIGFAQGSPSRLAAPFDSEKYQCGVDIPGYNYIYFLQNQKYEKFFCVKSCPTSAKSIVDYGYFNTAEEIIIQKLTAGNTNYPTYSLITVCIPTEATVLAIVSEYINIGHLNQIFHDISNSWKLILGCAGISIVLGFIYMIFMKWCAGLIVWGALIIYVIALGLLGYLSYVSSENATHNQIEVINGVDLGNKKQNLMILAIVLWSIGGISILTIFCLFERIRLAISVIECAAEFIEDVFYIYFVPLFMIVITLGFYTFWVFSSIYLYSSGTLTTNDIKTPFAGIIWDQNIQSYLIYMIFAIFWISQFLFSVSFFIIASSACIWYFNQGATKNNEMSPMTTSICRVFLHFGSLAFGSLIIAIATIVNLILEYLAAKMEGVNGHENPIISCTIKCILCYTDCFKRFLQFISRQAFIQIALQGKNFCASAEEAFYLLLRNKSAFVAVEGVGDIIIWIGQTFIIVITTLIGYLILTQEQAYIDNIYSPIGPLVLFAIAAYCIAKLFLSVYGVAADVILVCFLVDDEVHKKKGLAANYCPERLRKFLK